MTQISLPLELWPKLLGLASVLIPGAPDMPPPQDIADFEKLLRTAVSAGAWDRSIIVDAVSEIPENVTWEGAKSMALASPDSFHIASKLVSAAYFMAPAVLRSLGYPADRRQPADVEEFVEEYETGIYEKVTDRGPRFRSTGAAL